MDLSESSQLYGFVRVITSLPPYGFVRIFERRTAGLEHVHFYSFLELLAWRTQGLENTRPPPYSLPPSNLELKAHITICSVVRDVFSLPLENNLKFLRVACNYALDL